MADQPAVEVKATQKVLLLLLIYGVGLLDPEKG